MKNEEKSISYTGWPKSKFTFSISSAPERKRFWPNVYKAKMCLRGGGFLWELADFHMQIINIEN